MDSYASLWNLLQMVQANQNVQSWIKTLAEGADFAHRQELARALQLRNAMRMISAYEYEAHLDKNGYGSESQERRVEAESRWAGDAYRAALDKVNELKDIIEA